MKKAADIHNYGTAVHIGASLEAVKATSEVVLAILSANADEKTKRVALDVLIKACSVNNSTISNCAFYSGPQQAQS